MCWRFAFTGFAAIMATALCGCAGGVAPVGVSAQATEAGSWQITRKVDSVTGGTLTNVLLKASRTANSRYSSTPNAILQLGCAKGHLIAHLQFAFQIGSKADSEITYRLDDRPSRSIEGHILPGLKIVVIDDKREAAAFLSELERSNVLYVVISSLAKGRSAAEFPVAGAKAAVAATRAVCR